MQSIDVYAVCQCLSRTDNENFICCLYIDAIAKQKKFTLHRFGRLNDKITQKIADRVSTPKRWKEIWSQYRNKLRNRTHNLIKSNPKLFTFHENKNALKHSRYFCTVGYLMMSDDDGDLRRKREAKKKNVFI